MIQKFIRREIRRELRTGGYTDLLLSGLDNTIRGTDADALVTGALEIAAGIWGRTLAAATVTGTDALKPSIRQRIGRDLIRQGESVHEISTRGGTLRLEHVTEWDVLEGWRYRLDKADPPGKITQRTVPREKVAHFMWATNPREPWRGVAPLAASSKLATLAARVEDKLAQDLNTPIAHLVPIPRDGGEDTLDNLRGDIGDAEGAALLVESTAAGWDDGPQHGTRNDWKSERLGPMITDPFRVLWRDIIDATANACGIPAAIIHHDADGTAQREAWRRFATGSVQPVADQLAEVASEALDTDISFGFHALWAHDLQGRATAVDKLVSAGIELEEARRLAGLI